MKGTKTLLSYLLFIIGLQWKTVYALPTCPEGEWMCANKRCIIGSFRCDGEDDCEDNSDEKDCTKTHRKCDESTNFRCFNGNCVPQSYTCDGDDDCGDNSDELSTSGPLCAKVEVCPDDHFKCKGTGRCILSSYRCDGVNDCGKNDLTDESNCKSNTCEYDEFRCSNGTCISSKWRCDHVPDCADKSDEKNCSKGTCDLDKFQCLGNGHCIRGKYRCDGDMDCDDGSDEKDCKMSTTSKQPSTLAFNSNIKLPRKETTTKSLLTTATTLVICQSYQFKCTSSNKCIHKSWMCDGDPDCENLEDESKELCVNNICPDDHFKCHNGKCINKRYRCDGITQCPDKSDEQNCPTAKVPCSKGTYICQNSTKCIDPVNLCDGKKQCPNGDDEHESCGVNECLNNNGKGKCAHKCINKKIGYECRCRTGYALGNDNKSCFDINECKIVGTCSQTCINYKGSFACQCDKGYYLDHTDKKTCRAQAPRPFLVFSNRFDVRQISTNGNKYRSVVDTRSSAAVALHVKDEMIYWTDLINKTINRIHRNNRSTVETIVKDGLVKPESLAIDWIGEKLYWADTGLNTISVADLNGKHRRTLLLGNETMNLRTLAVYPEKGYIFWSDWGDKPKIERANLNGENRKTILDDMQVVWPSSISVDATLGRIFWADMNKRHICSSDVEGNDVRVVIADLTSPYGVTVFEDSVYWTDYQLNKLYKANKFHGRDLYEFGSYLSAPMDITVYHPLVQTKISHPCKNDNGGCSHLCFMGSNRNERDCSCPDFMKLGADKKTCHSIFATKTPALASCYRCHSSPLCIPLSSVCDGVYDCPEQDDELGKCLQSTVVSATTGSTKKDGSSQIYIIVGSVSGLIILLVVVIAVILYKRRRGQSNLTMIYETDQDVVHSKVDDKYIPKDIKYNRSNKKKKGSKNFDNVNFRPVDDARMPLHSTEVYGTTVVDEYPGGDASGDETFDDREPIMPHIV